ncbi:immunity 22 family protein [Rhizobacter sp. Root1221]|uniref:immunity 22 family protein n=1 Tax=Rhizobacter sp. Root1221 TaxID=1736433 RepID=UPI0009E85DE1|nr:immunity 22 family protein [Rhizobacter sp. Root1221]
MSSTAGEHHSDEFKRKVATEAYCATPPGGYPEVAARYGLEPRLIFDWVREFFPPSPPPFSSTHVWIGTTTQSLEEFNRYFSHADDYWDQEDRDALSPSATGCGFCVDLDSQYLYDGDLIYYQYFPNAVSVQKLVNELPLNTQAAEENILGACEKRGIVSANAVMSYADPEQLVRDPDKLYNGLIYLGLFKDRDA